MTLQCMKTDVFQVFLDDMRIFGSEAFLIKIKKAIISMTAFAERPFSESFKRFLAEKIIVQWAAKESQK